MTSHTGDEVSPAWSPHTDERNQMRARDLKSRDGEKLRGGWMEKPDEGLSFLPHRLLMKPNLQYLDTSALMIFQFYRYGQRMWIDENVKWNNGKIGWHGGRLLFHRYKSNVNPKDVHEDLVCLILGKCRIVLRSRHLVSILVIWTNLSVRSLTLRVHT